MKPYIPYDLNPYTLDDPHELSARARRRSFGRYVLAALAAAAVFGFIGWRVLG